MKAAALRYLKLAWDKARSMWYLSILLALTAFEFFMALLEIIMHVFRIPHWH